MPVDGGGRRFGGGSGRASRRAARV